MSKSNEKKAEQLGMPYGTACGKLRKSLLWGYIVGAKENFCFQCKGEILSIDDLSIEHKIPWLDSDDPVELFFDVGNVTYSHLSCNISAARRVKIHENPTERRKIHWKRYWDKMGKEKQQKRRRDNYQKYGC